MSKGSEMGVGGGKQELTVGPELNLITGWTIAMTKHGLLRENGPLQVLKESARGRKGRCRKGNAAAVIEAGVRIGRSGNNIRKKKFTAAYGTVTELAAARVRTFTV